MSEHSVIDTYDAIETVTTMDIPMDVKVHCCDGVCGRSTYIIIDPVSQQVTHLVVKQKRASHTERLVPVQWVAETTHDLIRLRCTRDELVKMQRFSETGHVRKEMPDDELGSAMSYFDIRPPKGRRTKTKMVPVKNRRIPPGKLAVQRGARVDTTDGHVGRVNGFVVDPNDGHITHLILRKGHLWRQTDVTMPASQIDRIEENTVYLKLDKRSIDALPAIPVRR